MCIVLNGEGCLEVGVGTSEPRRAGDAVSRRLPPLLPLRGKDGGGRRVADDAAVSPARPLRYPSHQAGGRYRHIRAPTQDPQECAAPCLDHNDALCGARRRLRKCAATDNVSGLALRCPEPPQLEQVLRIGCSCRIPVYRGRGALLQAGLLCDLRADLRSIPFFAPRHVVSIALHRRKRQPRL